MATVAQRRRARLERRRPRPVYEDPENEVRRRDCARQMALFDQLPAQARAAVVDGADDVDLAEVKARIDRRGPGAGARRVIQQRGIAACDLSFAELLALEITGG